MIRLEEKTLFSLYITYTFTAVIVDIHVQHVTLSWYLRVLYEFEWSAAPW